MRKIVAILIFFSLLFQSFSRILIIADYYANTIAYARDCINKALPMMHCNGKCQMMKKIQQEEKKDRENTERRENLKNLTLSSKSFFPEFEYPGFEDISSMKIRPASDFNTIDQCLDIFHPPQV